MGSAPRLAAVAAVSHARLYNHTQPHVTQAEPSNFNVNVFFVSATLCGVLVAVCAACWRRTPSTDKPEDVTECHGIYIVSGDARLHQEQVEVPSPPPAYETVVEGTSTQKDYTQATVTQHCLKCNGGERCDSDLPSYEAAVMLRDTKL